MKENTSDSKPTKQESRNQSNKPKRQHIEKEQQARTKYLKVYVFVDVSRNGETTFSIIIIQAEKLNDLGSRLSWVKHRRKIGRRARRGYDAAFLRLSLIHI